MASSPAQAISATHAILATRLCPRSQPRLRPLPFKADAFTISAIHIATVTEEATPKRLEFMIALPRALSSQNVLSLLVLQFQITTVCLLNE
jgi:hypothetical protein